MVILWITRCDSNLDGITIPIVLNAGGRKVEILVTKIETGASDCSFEDGFGDALGLRVEAGVCKAYSTANSRFEAYGHKLSVAVLGVDVTATVYFFADPAIQRNVLGRRGWLNDD